MKKFLSLALALIMTLSLVTISAGATEYKDFTDKDEIQYEEAVAVLNRLGIITGYSEGDFRPEGELTRGAAAKIIVSLLIGPEAAEALPTTNSPYPDVPAGNVFAGYISFCKTEKIINGYNDGTFRPTGTLTGFAFAKMLLSALGYDGNIEGFTGSGWTVRVAALGSKANLFNRLDFKGGETVNRETACLLALNTLKATMVQYTGGMNITTSDGSTMVVNPTREYVTSNQDYASHIDNRKVSDKGNSTADTHWTVEFGEEHFKDLRMERERTNKDDFGRPSNVWSYKKVTIGTYPVEADFTYTTQVSHNIPETTDASKVRALGLSGFVVAKDNDSTELTINGLTGTKLGKVADIANYTDNGTLVEVYVSDTNPDFIEDVVVIKTQLMEVKRVGSDYVSLDRSDVDGKVYGYNDDPIDVNVHDVEVGDDYYETLKALKAGDLVAVVPVTTDNVSYDVAKAYVPETATGKLTRVETFGTAGVERKAINVTVGGTKYNIAQWNRDLTGIDGDSIRVTNKDVTLILDEYGNALKAKDVGDTNNWMIIKNYRQGLVNGSIVTYANGWDISGEVLSLNVGGGGQAKFYEDNYLPGDLVYYSNNTNSNTAEWKLSKGDDAANGAKFDGVFDVDYEETMTNGDAYNIKASNTSIRLKGYETYVGGTDDRATIDTGIKFIYVNIDKDDHEVDSIEFVNGVKAATNEELKGVNSYYWNTALASHAVAQACVSLKDLKNADGKVVEKDRVTGDSAIKAVVIKRESTDASVSNLLYISNYHGSATLYDNDNRPVYGYEVVMMGSDGKLADDKAVVYSYRNLKIGQFARYSKVTAPENMSEVKDNFYELRGYGAGTSSVDDASSTWGRSAAVANLTLMECLSNDKYLVRTNGVYFGNILRSSGEPMIADTHDKVDGYLLGDGDGKADDLLNFRGASWVDLRKVGTRIEDIDDLKAVLNAKEGAKNVVASILFNDNPDSDSFRHVYLVVITGLEEKGSTGGDTTTKYNIAEVPGLTFSLEKNGTYTASLKDIAAGTTVYVKATDSATTTVKLDGVTLEKSGSVWSFKMPEKNLDLDNFALSSQITGKFTTELGFEVTYTATVNGSDTYLTATLTEWPEWVPEFAADGTTKTTIAGKVAGSIENVAAGTAGTLSFTKDKMTSSCKIAGFQTAGNNDIKEDTTTKNNFNTSSGGSTYFIPSHVAVKFVNADEGIDLVSFLNTSTSTSSVANDGTGAVIAAKFNTTSTEKVTLKVAAKAGSAAGGASAAGGTAANTSAGVVTAAAVIPDASLKMAITATLSAANTLTEAYSISAAADAGDILTTGESVATFGAAKGSNTLKLTASPDAISGAVAGGTTVTLKGELDTAASTGLFGYKVTVDLGTGESVDGYVTSATATNLGSFELTDNVELTKASITVEAVDKVAVKDATWNLNTITVNFNMPVKGDELIHTAAGAFNQVTVTAGASTLDNIELIMDGENVVGMKVMLAADVVSTGTVTVVTIANGKLISTEEPTNASTAAITLTAGANGAITVG